MEAAHDNYGYPPHIVDVYGPSYFRRYGDNWDVNNSSFAHYVRGVTFMPEALRTVPQILERYV